MTAGDGQTEPPGYKDLGYTTDSGVTITPAIEVDPQTAWQSAVPVIYNIKSASFSIKATLRETTAAVTELFFGASWVEVTSGEDNSPTGIYRLDLSSTPELRELSIVVDWSQGEVHNRVVIPRAMISDRGAIQLQRTEAQEYELTIEALDYGGQLGYLLTDNKAVA